MTIMRLLTILFFVFYSLYFSAAYSQTNRAEIKIPETKYYLKSDIWPYAILKFDANRDKNLFDKDVKPSTVSVAEINDIERFIKKRVISYNKSSNQFIARPEKYFKQIIAVINSNGDKIVWVNCMCTVLNESWKKTTYTVFDGGSCYFQLKINLTKKVVYDFFTNGLA